MDGFKNYLGGKHQWVLGTTWVGTLGEFPGIQVWKASWMLVPPIKMG